ncbi:hypothetical protein AC739_09435 [Planococcus glaciei]|nr:hypothetical protein AC739_09435 [Planococcus glaciei]
MKSWRSRLLLGNFAYEKQPIQGFGRYLEDEKCSELAERTQIPTSAHKTKNSETANRFPSFSASFFVVWERFVNFALMLQLPLFGPVLHAVSP